MGKLRTLGHPASFDAPTGEMTPRQIRRALKETMVPYREGGAIFMRGDLFTRFDGSKFRVWDWDIETQTLTRVSRFTYRRRVIWLWLRRFLRKEHTIA